MKIRVNRDHKLHRWTVGSVATGRRVGSAIGLMMQDVTFEKVEDSGWAIGDLYSWADMQLDKKFAEKLEARTVEYLAAAGETFHPLTFAKGEFFVYGTRIVQATWLRILGRDAFVSGTVPAEPGPQ